MLSSEFATDGNKFDVAELLGCLTLDVFWRQCELKELRE
jgi:hypothetical protein